MERELLYSQKGIEVKSIQLFERSHRGTGGATGLYISSLNHQGVHYSVALPKRLIQVSDLRSDLQTYRKVDRNRLR